MPVTAIPLEDTALVSDLPNMFSSTDPELDFEEVPPLHAGDSIYLQRGMPIPANGPNPEFLAGDFRVTPYDIKRYVIGTSAVIKPWMPNTNYYGERTALSGALFAPEVLSFEGDIYVVIVDFTSGATFKERAGSTIVLNRLSMDSDQQLLEVTGNARAPFTSGDEIASYLAIRRFTVLAVRDLPNERLSGGPANYNVAACNASITSPVVITIKEVSSNTSRTVGTITIADSQSGLVAFGDFVFNDTTLSGSNPDMGTLIQANSILSFELTTFPLDLEWININVLGNFINYKSPWYNLPE